MYIKQHSWKPGCTHCKPCYVSCVFFSAAVDTVGRVRRQLGRTDPASRASAWACFTPHSHASAAATLHDVKAASACPPTCAFPAHVKDMPMPARTHSSFAGVEGFFPTAGLLSLPDGAPESTGGLMGASLAALMAMSCALSGGWPASSALVT